MMETKRRREQRSMLPVHPDAAAIDIGATVHVAAVGPARDPEPVRSFGTFTGDLHRLADWFAQCGIKTVVMESTGVYWIPICEILDQRGFEVWVVNARARAGPQDRRQRCGVATAPARVRPAARQRHCVPICASVSDYWTTQPPTSSICRKHSLRWNLQIHHVISDITGATGMRIIRAIVAGKRDPDTLACFR